MKKLKDMVQAILHDEQEHRLFSLKFERFPVWPYYRMYFYYTFMYEKGILDISTSSVRFSWKYLWRLSDIFNIKKLLQKKEYFVLEHTRFNHYGEDIYTEEICNYIGKEKCGFFSYSEKGSIGKGARVVYLDLLKIVSKIGSRIFYPFIMNSYFNKNFLDFLQALEVKDVHKYQKQYKRYYLELMVQYYFYRTLLKYKKTHTVILVVSYYNMPLVFAAKSLGIKVVEMQHGVISPYHLGYHFPFYEGEFFPDVLCLFSDHWKDAARYPSHTELQVSGNSFMATAKEHLVPPKKDKTILVISQATIGEKLQALILKNRENLKTYHIYFKLHPSEFGEIEKKYGVLQHMPNVTLVSTEHSIAELQMHCTYQVGIYSTAIYEGIEKQCRTILLDETGIEYMENLIEKGIAKVVTYEERLLDVMHQTEIPEKICFFEPFCLIKEEPL